MRFFGKEIVLPEALHALVRQRRQKRILTVVKSVCSVMEQTDEEIFSNHFQRFYRELRRENCDRRYVYRKIMGMYGGMGSFNDIGLYKDGTLHKRKSTKLSKLRSQLYSLIEAELRDRLYLLPR